tara:strand:+ start:1766 stop:2452 length:687 start_codon:yes stop_codon:yes gene_type:complete
MIEIEQLKKSLSIDFEINIPNLFLPKGKNIAIIGNNGAGKTTLLELILDLKKFDEGRILINADDNKKFIWKKITSSYLDEQFLIQFYTPKEYMKFCSVFYNQDFNLTLTRLKKYDDFFNFKYFNEKKLIRNYSKGNKQKIGILSTLVFKSKLVILDEPFSHLDPGSKLLLGKILKENKSTTNIVSTHNIGIISKTFDLVFLMDQGKIIGTFDLENNPINTEQLYNFFR